MPNIKKKPACVPYSEAREYLKKLTDPSSHCGEENYIKECKAAFARDICNARDYICVPQFAGDCGDSLDGSESVCYGLQSVCYVNDYYSYYY